MSKASSVPFAIESTIFALDPGRSRASFPGKFINEVWFTTNKSLVFLNPDDNLVTVPDINDTNDIGFFL